MSPCKLISFLFIIFLTTSCAEKTNSFTGTGATSVYPLFATCSKIYNKKSGIQINYQSLGSAAGLKQLFSHTVDFSISTVPANKKDLQKYHLAQFPILVEGIVIAVNLPHIKTNSIVLNDSILANIYLGNIKFWDNRYIEQLNPSLSLPHKEITLLHRADGSGMTYNFTRYLSKINYYWYSHIGSYTIVDWPTTSIGVKGNAGMSAKILQIPYSICYVSLDYAKLNHLKQVKLKNQYKMTVAANRETISSSAYNQYYLQGNGNIKLNAWPIITTVFALVPSKKQNYQKNHEITKFLNWCFNEEKQYTQQFNFVPIAKMVMSKPSPKLSGKWV